MNQMIELLREGAFFCFIIPTLIAISLLVFVSMLCDQINILQKQLSEEATNTGHLLTENLNYLCRANEADKKLKDHINLIIELTTEIAVLQKNIQQINEINCTLQNHIAAFAGAKK